MLSALSWKTLLAPWSAGTQARACTLHREIIRIAWGKKLFFWSESTFRDSVRPLKLLAWIFEALMCLGVSSRLDYRLMFVALFFFSNVSMRAAVIALCLHMPAHLIKNGLGMKECEDGLGKKVRPHNVNMRYCWGRTFVGMAVNPPKSFTTPSHWRNCNMALKLCDLGLSRQNTSSVTLAAALRFHAKKHSKIYRGYCYLKSQCTWFIKYVHTGRIYYSAGMIADI